MRGRIQSTCPPSVTGERARQASLYGACSVHDAPLIWAPPFGKHMDPALDPAQCSREGSKLMYIKAMTRRLASV